MPAAIVTLVGAGAGGRRIAGGGRARAAPGGHYYEYVAESVDLGAAETYAEDRHAHLATIADAAENTFVQGLVTGDTAWLGGTDQASEGTSAWVTAEAFAYTNWAPAEPDDESSWEATATARNAAGRNMDRHQSCVHDIR